MADKQKFDIPPDGTHINIAPEEVRDEDLSKLAVVSESALQYILTDHFPLVDENRIAIIERSIMMSAILLRAHNDIMGMTLHDLPDISEEEYERRVEKLATEMQTVVAYMKEGLNANRLPN